MKDSATNLSVTKNLDLAFHTGEGPAHALKDVNLSINRADFVSFIGPSGCWKSPFPGAVATRGHYAISTSGVSG